VKHKFLLLFVIIALLSAAGVLGNDRGIPPSVIMNMGDVSPDAWVFLREPDVDAWFTEDAANRGKGVPYRIGHARDLPENSIDRADSIMDEDYGLVRRIAVHSPGAIELKIHLVNVNLPDTSCLYIYAEGETESDRYTLQDIYPDGTFWSLGSPGETIIVEWHWDDAPYEDVPMPFRLKEISHIYKDIYEMMEREGNCHNDATCDMDYRHQRDASAYIEFNDGGTYICSGVMLNSTAQNFIPYFLTANHCIGTQAVANTIKVWFFYHTQTCNGPTPPKGVRTVTGSTLLATGAANSGNGSDYALLRLNDADYSGIYFAGWDRNNVTTGTAVTGVHHPDGAYKRISYGTISSLFYAGQWGVTWNRTSNPGVTEPGSSGSGLFRDSNHTVIGQLWAGSSSCQNQNGKDFYGRFGKSFTHGNLGQWLGNANTCQGAYWGSSSNTPTPTPQSTQTPNPTWTPPPPTSPPTQTPVPTWTPSHSTQTPCPTRTPTSPAATSTPHDPTATPQYPTSTPENPTFTPAQPTSTPQKTSTPCQTGTPSPTPVSPFELMVSILMPSDMFHPGDPFECSVVIENRGDASLNDLPVFLILDVYGDLFFMPEAGEFSYYALNIPPGQTILKAVPMFRWPEGSGSAGGITWYAGITDYTFQKVLSNIDTCVFGWTDHP
jgi:hypothetical protein